MGLERYFSFLAAPKAYCREHLASGPVAVAAVSKAATVVLRFPRLTAFGTALGLVSVASHLELFLFLSAEGKGITAIGTFEGFVLKTHWMTSSPNN